MAKRQYNALAAPPDPRRKRQIRAADAGEDPAESAQKAPGSGTRAQFDNMGSAALARSLSSRARCRSAARPKACASVRSVDQARYLSKPPHALLPTPIVRHWLSEVHAASPIWAVTSSISGYGGVAGAGTTLWQAVSAINVVRPALASEAVECPRDPMGPRAPPMRIDSGAWDPVRTDSFDPTTTPAPC